jgi:glycosyltransferase involved in cell wall biosynthesis
MLTLSVISPAYNGEDCIIGFLESVAEQTWRDFEFVIVDDASTDRTADLIEEYLPRLGRRTLFIRHEKNKGEGMTVAEAFSKATGDIILKMDADSLFEPDTFAKIMESFAADEQVGVVGAPVAAMDRSNWISRGDQVIHAAQYRTDLKDARASGTCFAFRRHIFSTEDLGSKTDTDLSWMARKHGWRIVLREDITIRTRLLSTLPWIFARGRRGARQILPTYWHHKGKLLTRWAFWVKFAPLGLALTALFKPVLALISLLGWLVATQIFLALKLPDCPFPDRLSAWVNTVVRWSGFDLEVILMAVRAVANRFKPSQ